MAVDEFDGIFDGDDMSATVRIAMIDQCCQRSGLARTGTANKQDQAALGHDDLGQDHRQPEIIDVRQIGLDVANHHRHFAALLEDVDAKPPYLGFTDRQIHLQGRLEFPDLFWTQDRIGDFLDATMGERLLI